MQTVHPRGGSIPRNSKRTHLNCRSPFLFHLIALILVPLLIVALYEPKSIEKAKSSIVSAHVSVKLLTLIYSLTFITMTTFHMLPIQLSYYLEILMSASGLQMLLLLKYGNMRWTSQQSSSCPSYITTAYDCIATLVKTHTIMLDNDTNY